MRNPFRIEPAARVASPGLVVRSEHPFNAEPAPDRLRASFLTPRESFYVRSHGAVPAIDAAGYRLSVGGQVAAPLSLSLDDVRTGFPARTVMAALQCAGNRRADLHRVRPVSGDLWAPGAIGNAAWTGAGLGEVLRAAGAAVGPGLHVAFESADECRAGERVFRFGVSIPMGKALGAEVLLAYAMNGEALAAEHGAPLRVVVPGYAGVRSAKWVRTITVRDRPSDNPMQAEEYKLFPPDVTKETADPATGRTIETMPLTSAICDPVPGAVLAPGRVLLRGYAVSGERAVARVEVSADGGRRWRPAELEEHGGGPWSWTFWRAEVELCRGDYELVVRAWDAAGQTQAAWPDAVWNYRGYLSTAWHRVAVTVR